MNRPGPDDDEALARQRLIILNAIRFCAIGLVMLGFAIVRGVIDLPWALGAALAVIGMFEFFFLPRFIARRWNAGGDPRR